jgi:hypothetical protein
MSLAKTLSGKKWLNTRQLFTRDIFLKQIESTLQLNRSHNIDAVFLFGIQKSLNTYRKGALRYSFDSAFVKELAPLIKDNKTGIHVNQIESISFQIEQFEALTGYKPEYMRTHYFGSLSHSQLDELNHFGVKTDFSGGNTTYVGYTAPRKDNRMKQICTLLSDNNFVRLNNDDKVWSLFEETLRDERVNTNGGAILFHPENFLVYPDFTEKYLKAIELIKQSGLDYYKQN